MKEPVARLDYCLIPFNSLAKQKAFDLDKVAKLNSDPEATVIPLRHETDVLAS